MAKILVVDDELTILEVLKPLLRKGGHDVTVSNDGSVALQILKENIFDLMITDVRLPGIDGIALLHKSKELQSQLAVIVMTAYADVDNAVNAMKNGAFDYVTKPFKFDELMLTIDRALSYEKVLAENKVLRTTLETKYHFNNIVGDSEPMLEVYNLIEKVAKTSSTILILGGSGTGKELVAKAIHESSPRSCRPFVEINCSAMPENLLESELFGYVKGAFTGANSNKKGLFETANTGTIFLDEIGSIPINMQMKLLRVLQEKTIRHVGGTENIAIDVRVIAATNENLEAKIKNGEFREDLYYRLSVIPTHLPLLRDRHKDIPLLVSHFLAVFEKENKRDISITTEAVQMLRDYSWPGNVRELENLINRLATLCDNDQIEAKDLPSSVKQNTLSQPSNELGNNETETEFLPLKKYLKRLEENYIGRVIKDCNGDKELAANKLDISVATLYRKYNDESK